MRKLAALALLAFACASPAPLPAPTPALPAEPHGLTIEEEANILALEDRREHNAEVVNAWIAHPNPLHRLRIALALGRIGAITKTGVTELAALSKDDDRRVRETTAFALGEIASGAETLFTLAADSDAAVAAEAVEALSKLATDKTLVPRYIAIADNASTEGVRARAVRYLFRWDDDTASEAARRALESPSSAVRQEGAYSLARRAYPPAREELLLVMTDPNTLTRAYATTALGRIGDPSAFDAFRTALGDAHPWVRTNAAIAIGRLAERNRALLHANDLPRVFAAAEDPDPGVRASMIDVLGYYAENNDTARARLFQTLRNGTMWERELTAGAIAKHLPWATASEVLTDLTPWQIVRVLEATTAMPHGVELRKQYVRHADPLVRANALSNIPETGGEAEIELIRLGITDADVIVRANAYDRLGFTKDVPIDWLREVVEGERTSPMNDARLAAMAILAKHDAASLQPLLSDPDPVVRRVAAEAVQGTYTPLTVARTPEEYAEIARWSRQPHTATIHMTRGKIELALLSQEAPMTAWNFAQLAKKKYFDNSSFMRVVPNFVIQGGDPRNDMNGGPGYSIRDEINLQKYTRGAVGMALSGPDTGGSQFFVTHSPQPHLDGGYTIFGRVYDGMSGVVDQTERGDRVVTITIDEHAPVADISTSNVSLPLEIGPMNADRLIERVPDYAQRKSDYTPDITVLEMMKSYIRADDRVEVYMGTWCPDSQREVPKFLRIVDDLRAQFGVELPVTFVALDRDKAKPADLIAGKHIEKVATFIYYRGDKELGRIVEKTQSPLFEDDLLALVAK
ncbi:MAG TPA: HEAT repeat domain-containing protein [Thermoanaerobaculia bacterium]|jgi:cyclophilin family peptidyl-prolyl cis-trans isomerase/HEAT repeat protein|nr:HEAT repeat domain-containing protein [Thermoanaerobaculia bacterium]